MTTLARRGGFRYRGVLIALVVLLPFVVGATWLAAALVQFRVDQAQKKRDAIALTKIRRLNVAALEYALDHKGKLPNASRWESQLAPYLDRNANPFVVPGLAGKPGRRFAMNRNLSGRTIEGLKTPADTVLFFESVSDKPSAADVLESLPRREVHGGFGYAIGYADGHAYIQPYGWKEQAATHPYFHDKTFGP